MTATPFDSAHLHKLFAAGEIGKLFSDSAEIRAMMIVLGTLAKVQGAAGVIPETAAKAIHRASLELQVDPRGLFVRLRQLLIHRAHSLPSCRSRGYPAPPP